jgi:hypothetical protein
MFLRGFLAGMFALVVAIVAVGMLAKAFSQQYISTTIGSYHFDRDKDYNERNLGLGYERHSGQWSFLTGYYRNSYYKDTVYLMAGYQPFYLQFGNWRGGIVGGLVTGYDSPFLAGGVVSYNGRRYGLNIILAPVAIALQVKWKL